MWKTGYVAIASRRREGRGNQLVSKTGYVEIASRLVTVARFCSMGVGLMPSFYQKRNNNLTSNCNPWNKYFKHFSFELSENIPLIMWPNVFFSIFFYSIQSKFSISLSFFHQSGF
jgi:hypothetical protein